MLRRPIQLLTLGLMAIATSSAPVLSAEDAPRSRRGGGNAAASPSSKGGSSASSGNTGRSAPSLPKTLSRPDTRGPSLSQPSGGKSGAAPIQTFRSKSEQAPKPASGSGNNPTPIQRALPQLSTGQSSGNNAKSATQPQAFDRGALQNRVQEIRGQSPSGNPSTPTTTNRQPTMNGGAGGANLDALRQRMQQNPQLIPPNSKSSVPSTLDQFRNRQPSTEGSNRQTPNLGNTQTPSTRPNLPNVGTNPPNVGNLRDRLPNQPGNTGGTTPGLGTNRPNLGSGTPGGNTGNTPNLPGTRNPMGNADLERLRDRFQDSVKNRPNLEGTNPPSRPGTTTPNLDSLRDRLETRKPEMATPGNPNTDRSRERLPGLQPGNNDNRNPNRPGNLGSNENGPRIDLDRINVDRSQLRIEPNRFDRDRAGRVEFADRFRDTDRIRNTDELRDRLGRFEQNPEVRDVLRNSSLRVTDLSGAFQTRIGDRRAFDNIVQSNIGRQYNLDRQFNLYARGDVTRQLNLNQTLIVNGGWGRRTVGPVYSRYTSLHFSAWYPGPAWYPRHCWTPIWSPWVRWSFWDFCRPIYDPRPFICRPIYYYDPCPPIVYYDYPAWQPLPVVASGTWVDVPVQSVAAGYDLQLLAVRFVDAGHPEENLGPRYRVWVRNNSTIPVQSPFNVMLIASNDMTLRAGLPEAGVTVDTMEPGAVIPVDIRLPMEANRLTQNPNGHRTPFTMLHVLVDSHRELAETDETNNGLAINPGEILPVDPAAFATEEPSTFPGSMVSLAGEGFGPEPGQLIVIAGNQQIPAEVHGWYDLGVYFKMPNLPLTGANTAQLMVIRGDGAASNPVTIALSGN